MINPNSLYLKFTYKWRFLPWFTWLKWLSAPDLDEDGRELERQWEITFPPGFSIIIIEGGVVWRFLHSIETASTILDMAQGVIGCVAELGVSSLRKNDVIRIHVAWIVQVPSSETNDRTPGSRFLNHRVTFL